MSSRSIAVIGGGITGLTSAFYLLRRFPTTPITIFEKSPRVGGWINSRRVAVKDEQGRSANMLLETGPRTLRPSSSGAVLELINLLNLKSSLITVPRTSPAARRRLVKFQNRPNLELIPHSIQSAISSPYVPLIMTKALTHLLMRSKGIPEELDDESLDTLITWLFGRETAELASALAHGIYAADSRKLSVRAGFPALWSIASSRDRRFWLRKKTEPKAEEIYDVGDVKEVMQGISVFSFTDGVSTLSSALRNFLATSKNVTFRTEKEVVSLHPDRNSENIQVALTEGEISTFTHAVSAIPLPSLQSLIPSASQLPHLTSNPSSTVTVINIVFPPTERRIHPEAFGYLTTRPASGYESPNSGILGTVFDSCSLGQQDHYEGDSSPRFTKLTVMMGGPFAPALTPAHYSVDVVLSNLRDHLNYPGLLPQPCYYEATEQVNCIPTLLPGHLRRMDELKRALNDPPWNGRLDIIGAGVGGVSVGDCVRAGRSVGKIW